MAIFQFVVYQLLLCLSLPLVLLRLWRRGRKEPAYRQRWRERLGALPAPPAPLAAHRAAGSQVLWLHAVSVGEVRAAAPLVRMLLQQYPKHVVFMTCTTPTASAVIQQLFGDAVWHSYLAYDVPFCLGRVWRKLKPALLILMEKELWPYLLYCARRSKIPVLCANAQLSISSTCGYLKIKKLMRYLLGSVAQVMAQSAQDKLRYVLLGVPMAKVMVVGNIKYALRLPEGIITQAQQLRAAWPSAAGNKQLETMGASTGQQEKPWYWTAGSIHAQPSTVELDAVISAQLSLLKAGIAARLILVPRHLRDLACYEKALQQAGLSYARYQDRSALSAHHQVLLVDVMGALLLCYAASDVAYVGGSLVPVGGHNLLEPAALEKAVVCGNMLANCQQVADELVQANALQVVRNAAELSEQLLLWAQQPDNAQAQTRAAKSVLAAHADIMQRYRDELERLIQP